LYIYLGGLKGFPIVSCVIKTQITKYEFIKHARARTYTHTHTDSAMTRAISRRRPITVEALVQYK